MQSDSELTRPKSRPLLSTSTDRDELIEAGVCIACRCERATNGNIYGSLCYRRLSLADVRAFKGYRQELRRSQ